MMMKLMILNLMSGSLAHLSILMELDKNYPGKITSIEGIAEMNNFAKLVKVLNLKKILDK